MTPISSRRIEKSKEHLLKAKRCMPVRCGQESFVTPEALTQQPRFSSNPSFITFFRGANGVGRDQKFLREIVPHLTCASKVAVAMPQIPPVGFGGCTNCQGRSGILVVGMRRSSHPARKPNLVSLQMDAYGILYSPESGNPKPPAWMEVRIERTEGIRSCFCRSGFRRANCSSARYLLSTGSMYLTHFALGCRGQMRLLGILAVTASVDIPGPTLFGNGEDVVHVSPVGP